MKSQYHNKAAAEGARERFADAAMTLAMSPETLADMQTVLDV